jgi:hypothetical protein
MDSQCWKEQFMKRPKQHQIEEKAYDQFKASLPNYWIVRSQTHDYGIDREVEIFSQNKCDEAISTGYIFKTQVKGTENAKISKDGDLIKFRLEIDRANYLCNEISIPVFFVLADVKKDKTWWYAIQLDKDLKQRLNIANKEKKKRILLNIPTKNILPASLELLITTLDDIKMSYACHSFVTLPQSNFDNLSLSLDEIVDLEKKFIDKIFVTKITKLWESKDYDGIEKVSKDALNTNSSTATKVSAILCMESVQVNKNKETPALQVQLDKIYLNTAAEIKKITKDEKKIWKMYSAIVWRAALLRIACSDDFALHINNKIHKAENGSDGLDFICRMTLGIARQQALKRVLRIYNQCCRLTTLVLNSGEYWMLPQVILRIAHALPPVFIHLWDEKLEETAVLFQNHFTDILRKTVGISFALKRWDDVAQLLFAAFALNSQKNQTQYNTTYNWAVKTLNEIPDKSRQKEWLDFLNNRCQVFNPEKNNIEFEKSDTPTEEEYQIYIQMAHAMGINLDNPTDRIAQIVRIGLQDLNPERVLKRCKHLFVYIGHYGIPAEMLKLYTAGSKYLRCLKKDVAIGGHSLDSIYNSIQEEYCSKCKDIDPWPTNWKWTRTWQNIESEKETHKKFKEKINNF